GRGGGPARAGARGGGHPRAPGAGLVVPPRAGGPHLRRAGRGPQVGPGPPPAAGLRRGDRDLSLEGRDHLVDLPGPVRAGEEIDLAALDRFLATALPELQGALTVEQFPSGFSNLTYLARKGEREMVLRRPPFGAAIKSAHDMGREYRILSALAPMYPKAPRPLAFCEDVSVLGAPFYLMEGVRGVILRPGRPALDALGAGDLRAISEAVVDALAELHALDYTRTGLAGLGRHEGYVERQVRGWTARYQAARTHDLADMERVAA